MAEKHTIQLTGVSKVYGSGHQSVPAVSEVDLTIRRGEFVAMMGPSGCGKSTLLNLIAGIDTPTTGRIVVCDADLHSLSDDARSDLRLRSIGFIFQSFHLFPTFTVTENVAWPLEFLGTPWQAAAKRANEALERVGIATATRTRTPPQLSGGEQQRVAMARAIVTQPELLLADEPTGNLDSRTGAEILDLLTDLNRKSEVTILMVTHSDVAAARAMRTLHIRDGRLVNTASVPNT